MIAIATKLDPSMTRSDSLIGSVIGKPGTLPENSYNAKIEVNLFDTAVGSGEEIKVSANTNRRIFEIKFRNCSCSCLKLQVSEVRQ